MRKTTTAGLAILVLTGVGTATLVADAQPAAPPATASPFDRAGPNGPVPLPPPCPGWMPHPHHPPFARRGMFALVYPQNDRRLTPPDVQKIAEAFLLWNGNHRWKVVDVATTPDGLIAFAFATQEGSVVARFAMDPHTGRLSRTE